jgi:pyrimidine operon attenuation protein / uracil phosphoribosyltransferase
METVKNRECVLEKESIRRKMKRMALEVAERNSDEKELVIAGIAGNGEVVAKCLVNELRQLALFSIGEATIQLNKKDPVVVTFDPPVELENKVVIIVDDVANTGKTMMYAFKPLLDIHPRKVQTLVLVERSHKLFPVQTDYAGLSITTTLQEHIAVETDGDEIAGAWLY